MVGKGLIGHVRHVLCGKFVLACFMQALFPPKSNVGVAILYQRSFQMFSAALFLFVVNLIFVWVFCLFVVCLFICGLKLAKIRYGRYRRSCQMCSLFTVQLHGFVVWFFWLVFFLLFKVGKNQIWQVSAFLSDVVNVALLSIGDSPSFSTVAPSWRAV